MAIDRPIFLVGMGRSGTTAVFESIANHPDLGWLSHHFERFPRVPALAAAARLCDLSPWFRKAVSPSSQRRTWLERLRDGPSEAYSVWATYCGEKFRYDYLLGQRASAGERFAMRAVVEKVLRYQGKARFAAKLTGPARMGFLLSLFEDARFVHIIRDGRAVVHSLMNVSFWRDTHRFRQPAWEGGLPAEALEVWKARNHSPLVLAALQWKNVIERTREERAACSPQGYLEVRYEDFLSDPHRVVEQICRSCELSPSRRIGDFIDRRLGLRNPTERFRERFSSDELDLLNELLADLLVELGYRI